MDIREEIEKGGGLVTLADIARIAGVSHSAARKWRQRPDWPAALATVGRHTAQPTELYLVADYRKWQGEQQARIGRAAMERP